jgi:predicted ester cyclase
MPGITIFRLDNGKIAEGWVLNDNLSLMQQLGAIPAP